MGTGRYNKVSTQWLSDLGAFLPREPGFEFYAAVSNLGQYRLLYIASVRSAVLLSTWR